jgi:hypothetical protein
MLFATGSISNGTAKTPFPNNASIGSANACSSSTSCGSSKQTVSASSFLSLDENNANFLKPTSTGMTISAGSPTACIAGPDYFGINRSSSDCDIGAMEFSGEDVVVRPREPTGLVVQ